MLNHFISRNDIPTGYDIASALGNPALFSINSDTEGYLLSEDQLQKLLSDNNYQVANQSGSSFRDIVVNTITPVGEVVVAEAAEVIPTINIDEIFEGLPEKLTGTGRRRVSTIMFNGNERDVFKKLTEKILLPVLDKGIVIKVPHGSPLTDMAIEEANQDKFTIYIWSQIEATPKLSFTPEKVWGIPVDCRDAPFTPTNEGMGLIYDEATDYVLGEVFSDCLFIHHDVVHEGSLNEFKLYRKILENTVEILSNPDARKAAIDLLVTRNMRNFTTLCLKGREEKIRNIKAQLDESTNHVNNYTEKLTQAIRTRDGHLADLPRAKEAVDMQKADFEKNFEQLCNFADVKDVQVFPDRLEIFTDTLYCVDPRSKLNHEIGKFKIRINARGRDGSIRWYNLDRSIKGYESRMQAPHVFPNGTPCLGSLEGVIPQYLAVYDFATLTQLAIAFIQSVNINDSAGAHIKRWPIAKEDWDKAREQGIEPESSEQKSYVNPPYNG